VRDSPYVSAHIEQKARTSRLIAWAREQWGVISLEQLLAIGFTYGEVRVLVKRGHLIPLHRGVFAVGHLPQLTKGYLKAALLAAGPNAFLSHRTAVAVWGLREVSTRRIDVSIRGRRRSRGSLMFHQAWQADVVTRGGLLISSFPQMLIELAPRETDEELERLVTWGFRKDFLKMDVMRLALKRAHRRPGTARLDQALGAYLPTQDRKSDLERDFDAFLVDHPEIPQPRRNVYIDGWEIDCFWPEFRLAVELDGRPYHIAVRDMEKDRVKDAKLLVIGIRTLRITDTRFNHDRPGVYADLTSLLTAPPTW
jgi:putative AbiEi antitoxin of type IV toxin-antitoxin system